ncbi:peptidase M15-like protein [Rhodovulum bhavnagarense]|uniref:Murein endopeptidase K n=1 Tax=Rhodovulum bhavnagarense TaxID=992286 RepID=A0A4R2R7M7_9RHOB|nr:D-Ala-D-Ala carboxypeptidase family metallohydrolase [Rhodovulum bhavnagarense]TCP58613.1 peptidase M15-like protein [Rhodovulum bhavnagarense]
MPTLTYPHWRDVPATAWRWPNFSAAEIACRGTGAIKINTEAMDKLQALRDRLGKPLIIRSAYRSPEHNRAVDGAPASKHMQATAFDITMANHDPVTFEAAARAVGFLGFGYYPRSGFIHIDLGPARSWGDPFPARAVPFAPELPPAREVLSESRTLRGGGAAGAATFGAAGVEVLQDVLAVTQSTIQPLVPYLDTLRWVLIAIALIGIAVTIHARLDDWKRGQR